MFELKKYWIGGNLPYVHWVEKKRNFDISGFGRKWFLHPIKRRLAKYYLAMLRKYFNLKVIGITGSSGKTSVKEMLSSILNLEGKTVTSYKNIDPVYNIPSTILKCRPSTKYLVIEMGVEYPGEMEYYLWLANLDVGVITNINPTHLEYFKSIDGVFKEKIKIAKGLTSEGVLILNHNDKYLKNNIKNIKTHIIYFGNNSQVYATDIKATDYKQTFHLHLNEDKVIVTIPTFGERFVDNALTASAVGKFLNIPITKIKEGLERYRPPEHRMNIFKTKNGSIIIDDSYNNNPKAANEALKNLDILSSGREKGVVFGDMLELGNESEYYHQKIGKVMSKMKLKFVIYVGKFDNVIFNEIRKRSPDTVFEKASSVSNAYNLVRKYLKTDFVILIKGSHSLRLDLIADRLSK